MHHSPCYNPQFITPWGSPHLHPALHGETLTHPHRRHQHPRASVSLSPPTAAPLPGDGDGGGARSRFLRPPPVLPPPRRSQEGAQTAPLGCGFGLALIPPAWQSLHWGTRPGLNWVLRRGLMHPGVPDPRTRLPGASSPYATGTANPTAVVGTGMVAMTVPRGLVWGSRWHQGVGGPTSGRGALGGVSRIRLDP